MTHHRYESFAERHLDIAVRNGSEYMVRCLFHENNGTAAMQFNVDKGMFVCFSCGAGGGMKKLTRKLGLKDYTDRSVGMNDLLGALNKLRNQSDQDPVLTVLPEDHLSRYDFPTDYWTGRGFTEETIDAFDLGFDPISNAAIIPVRNMNGGLLGVIRRFLDEDAEPRYKYPFGFKRRHHLFGSWLAEHEPSETAVIVEGAVDAMAVWQAGFIGLAQYGSSMGLEQVRLLRRLGVTELVFMFDNDKAGKKALRACQGQRQHLRGNKVVEEYDRDYDLRRQFRCRAVRWRRNHSDPGALAAKPVSIRNLVARSRNLM